MSICVATALLTLVYMIPNSSIKKNAEASLYIFEKEGTYYDLTEWCSSRLNNFTDGHLLLQAIYDGEESALIKAMKVYEKRYVGFSPDKSLVLNYAKETEEKTYNGSGARYWHGYLIFTTPLLVFLNYGQMRALNLVLQMLINVFLIITLYKKQLKAYIIPYIISLCLIMPLTLAYTIVNSFVFYIFSIGSIILIHKNEDWKKTDRYFLLFLIMGLLTSFFDYLTYPLATFGIPITFFICMNCEANVKENLKAVFVNLFAWGFGYAGMWSGKWVISSIICKENVFLNGIDQARFRMSSDSNDGTGISTFDVLHKNVSSFINNPLIYIALLYLALVLFFMWKTHQLNQIKKNILAFGLIALLPFGWYLGLRNHSYIHFWFTYKELMITSFSVLCCFTIPLVNNNK